MATSLKETIAEYGGTLDPSLATLFSQDQEINSQYQLTPGTETDFNNCATFLTYALAKNSDEIANYETSDSEKFGNYLLKYYNSYLSDDDVKNMVTFINSYNKSIDEKYKYKDNNNNNNILKDGVLNIMADIYGIDYKTKTISSNSAAEKVYKKVKENNSSITDPYLDDFCFYKTFDLLLTMLDDDLTATTTTTTTTRSTFLEKKPNDESYASYNEQNSSDDYGNIILNTYYVKTKIEYSSLGIYFDVTLGEVKDTSCTITSISGVTLYVTTTDLNNANFGTDGTKYLLVKPSTGNENDNYYIKITKATASGNPTNKFSDVFDTKKYSTISDISPASGIASLKIQIYSWSPDVSDGQTISDISNNAKRSASGVEVYNALAGNNVNYFYLQNIKTEDNTFLNYFILYKELNPAIRSMDLSDFQNKLFYKFVSKKLFLINSDTNIIELAKGPETLFEIISNYNVSETTTDGSTIKYDDIQVEYYQKAFCELFNDFKTNSFMIRNGVRDDIVGYLCGKTIGYGTTEDEKSEIETILELYKEVREYFYKVLFHKSYADEEFYKIYVQLFIKAYTIERFISSRIDNSHNIDKFSVEDCKNFFYTYGLKELYDQMTTKKFNSSTLYMKRIIANYNKLMQNKGTTEVISLLDGIFSESGSTTLDFEKYLLMNKNSNISFVPIPYDKTDAHHAIESYENNALSLSEITENDPYWGNSISEDDLKEIVTNPIVTKYLGIALSQDCYLNSMKARYALSIMNYLISKISTTTDNETTYLLDNLKISNEITIGNTTYTDQSLRNVLKAVQYLYYKYFSSISSTVGTSPTIYGISEKPSSKVISSDGFYTTTNIDNLFSREVYTYSSSSWSKADSKKKFYTVNEVYNIFPYTSLTNADIKGDILGLSGANSNVEGLVSSGIFATKISDVTKIDKSLYETLKAEAAETNNQRSTSSIEAINCAFKSISFLLSDIDLDTIKAMYYHYKFQNGYENVTSTQDFNDDMKSYQNVYQYIFENIIEFPINYISGKYTNNQNIKYDRYTQELLDNVFTTFFTTTTTPDFTKPGNADTNIYAGVYDVSETSDITKYLTEILNALNTTLVDYPNMQLNIVSSSDLSNTLEFIILAVQTFISYTTKLQTMSGAHTIDTPAETCPISYEIKSIQYHNELEYLYSDEEITITEFDEPEEKDEKATD